METSFEIWTGAVLAKGGYGGWSYLRRGGGDAQGVAGGDRRTTGIRMELMAVIEALQAAADRAAPVRLYARSPELLAWPAATDRIPADQDLWDRLAKALSARSGPVVFVDAATRPDDQAAVDFVQGWAAFALDIAKTKGAFSSPIPKRNLQALAAKG